MDAAKRSVTRLLLPILRYRPAHKADLHCSLKCTGDQSCVNGVCQAVNACSIIGAGTCSNGDPQTCACFRTTSGSGVCSAQGSTCAQPCATSQDCPNGSDCSAPFNCCLDASDVARCPNPLPSKLFVKRALASTDSETAREALHDGHIYFEKSV